MGRALIIGCGGVAGVVIHKCCQNSDVFEEIMIASRTKSKCDAIKECIVKEMGKKIGTVVCCEDDKQQQVKAFVTELNRTLPLYKRISVVECSAEPLPRNALGKLLRK